MTNTTDENPQINAPSTTAGRSPGDVITTIVELAAKQGGVAVETVSPATHFQNDLNFDSLDAVEFTMSVEEALGAKIPDDKVAELTTVQMVIDYVKDQKS